jgi:hypothetical protein
VSLEKRQGQAGGDDIDFVKNPTYNEYAFRFTSQAENQSSSCAKSAY